MASEMIPALKSLHGFSALGEGMLDRIAAWASVRAVRAGETVFCQGEPSPYCFGVLSGEVIIQHVSKDSRFAPKILGVVGTGGLFGESALFEDSPRAAMATASKDGKLAVIRGQELREWLKRNPADAQPLLLALLHISQKRLHRTSHELAVVHGLGRLLGTDKPFMEQLAAVLAFIKGSLEGLDDLIFYQRSAYWDEFSPLMSLPALPDLPGIPVQNEVVQKANISGGLQLFDPAKIKTHMEAFHLPTENRRSVAVLPLFDWDKASDPLQGLLFLSGAREIELFSAGEKLVLTSIAYPLAETLSRSARREDSDAQTRHEQSKKTV